MKRQAPGKAAKVKALPYPRLRPGEEPEANPETVAQHEQNLRLLREMHGR